jgi:ketosteroid isomerase-like protein
MSQENVEIVRRAYERVNATLELSQELYDPNVEFDVGDVSVEFGVIRGLEPAQEALREYWQTFENFHVELIEVFHADEDRVITSVEDGGRMKGSGAEVWNRLFHVTTFRDGKIVRFSSHTDKNRALEAAGLSK